MIKNNKLVGFIGGVPATIRVYDKPVKMVEINYLCVHKKLRSKRVAPVLIKEITRRVNLQGIFQAVYTAGVILPTPVGKCRFIFTYRTSFLRKSKFDCAYILNLIQFLKILASFFEPEEAYRGSFLLFTTKHDYATNN